MQSMGPMYMRTPFMLDLARHLCVTAGADTVARRERCRGLHALPADVLLTPGTDDQKTGKGLIRARALHGFTFPRNLLSHILLLSPRQYLECCA
jgi:hypothetical protein